MDEFRHVRALLKQDVTTATCGGNATAAVRLAERYGRGSHNRDASRLCASGSRTILGLSNCSWLMRFGEARAAAHTLGPTLDSPRWPR